MKLEFLDDGSPDCPLIRLYGFSHSDAVRLRDIFVTLSNGPQREVALHEQHWIEPVAGCKLLLQVAPRDIGIHPSAALEFQCGLRADTWSDMAGLVEPFCTPATSSGHRHQWLNTRSKISLMLSTDGLW